MTKSAVPPTYVYQNRPTTQHQPPMLPSQSPFIPRHLPHQSGSCNSLPPSATAVPSHFHYAPVHHHPQPSGLYVGGGGQSSGARSVSRPCDVTSMPPPGGPSCTSTDSMVELNAFQLMASGSYPNRYQQLS